MCFIKGSIKQKQKCGKQCERYDGGNDNALHQNDADVKSDTHTHKQECEKTCYRGKCTCRDRLCNFLNCRCHSLPLIRFGFLDLTVTVKKHDTVVYRKCKLQYGGNGVGNIGDLTENNVCSHIDKNCHARSQQKNDRFKPRLRGDQHNGDNKAYRNGKDERNLALHRLTQICLFHNCTTIVQLTVKDIVKLRFYIINYSVCHVGILITVYDYDEQGVSVLVIALVVLVKIDGQNVLDVL